MVGVRVPKSSLGMETGSPMFNPVRESGESKVLSDLTECLEPLYDTNSNVERTFLCSFTVSFLFYFSRSKPSQSLRLEGTGVLHDGRSV